METFSIFFSVLNHIDILFHFLQVYLRHSCNIWRGREAHQYTLHARKSHYGHHRYDFVQVDSGTPREYWYARLLAIFDVRNTDGDFETMALVWWLELEDVSHVPDSDTFQFWGEHASVIDVDTVRKPVLMVTSPRKHQGRSSFILLHGGKQGMKFQLQEAQRDDPQ